MRCTEHFLLLHRSRHDTQESSDDEQHFQRKEKARLARDTAKLNPIILGIHHSCTDAVCAEVLTCPAVK